MKNAHHFKSIISVSLAFALILSVFSAVLTASAEGSTTTIFQLLKNESARWATEGLQQRINLTNEISEKTVNSITAAWDTETDMRCFLDLMTPEQAGFNLTDVQSVSYFIKNTSENKLNLELKHFTDRASVEGEDGEWTVKEGVLSGGLIYLADTLKGTVRLSREKDGIVDIPAGFEGYIVYDVPSCTVKTLLDADTTFGQSVEFVFSKEAPLSAGKTLYYGEISANTIAAKSFIEEKINSPIYNYEVTTGLSWGLGLGSQNDKVKYSYNGLIDEAIASGEMVANLNEYNCDQIGFYTKKISDYNVEAADVSAVSWYVKNSGGKGSMNLRLGAIKSNWEFINWLYYWRYDINTGEMSRQYGENIIVPDGFEGYVIMQLPQDGSAVGAGSINIEKINTIFNDGQLNFLQGQSTSDAENHISALAGLNVSFGNINIHTGSFNEVLTKISNKCGLSKSYASDNGSAVSTPFGEARRFDVQTTGDWSGCQGAYVIDGLLPDYYTKTITYTDQQQAMAFWVQNPNTDSMDISMVVEQPVWGRITPSYKLFNMSDNTISDETNGEVKVPAGFEGYILVLIDNSKIGNDSMRTYFNNNGTIVNMYLSVNCNTVPAGGHYLIGSLSFASNIDIFIENHISVTTKGDVNRDNYTNILDLVRVKKYLANSNVAVYRPNVSFSGNYGICADTMVNMRKLLLGAETPNVYLPKDTGKSVYTPLENTVGMAIYHHSVGEWEQEYGDTIAHESNLLNYYIANDISDLRQIKNQGASAWIYINPDIWQGENTVDARKNFEKYIDTIKNEGLWNVVAGFHFEEPASTTDLLDSFEQATVYLNGKYPEKRIFVVLSTDCLNVATSKTYALVTDIGFDDYYITTADDMRTKYETLKTNTGLDNARYWYFPAASCNPDSEDGLSRILTQIDICTELLTELPVANRGGMFLYNWKTFDNDPSKGLKDLLKLDNFSSVGQKIIETSARLISEPTTYLANDGASGCSFWNNETESGYEFKAVDGVSPDGKAQQLHFTQSEFEAIKANENPTTLRSGEIKFNQTFNKQAIASAEAFGYYVKVEPGEVVSVGFNLINGGLSNLVLYAFDIRTGSIKQVSNLDFTDFEGYIIYDTRNATIYDNSYSDGVNATTDWDMRGFSYLIDRSKFLNRAVTFDSIRFCDSFESLYDYYSLKVLKATKGSTILNDGTSGAAFWNGYDYQYTTVNDVSPDGAAQQLCFTDDTYAAAGSPTGGKDGGITFNKIVDSSVIANAQVLYYYVNLEKGEDIASYGLGLPNYLKFTDAKVYTYNIKTGEFKENSNLSGNEFEGYVFIDLRGATVTGDCKTFKNLVKTNGLASLYYYTIPNCFVNRAITFDSIAVSSDFCGIISNIISK